VHPKYKEIESLYAPVFDGGRVIIYTFLDSSKKIDGRSVKIPFIPFFMKYAHIFMYLILVRQVVKVSGTTGTQPFSWEVVYDPAEDGAYYGSQLHRLTANHFVKYLFHLSFEFMLVEMMVSMWMSIDFD